MDGLLFFLYVQGYLIATAVDVVLSFSHVSRASWSSVRMI